MPNWCDTTYRCVGDKKEIHLLKKILDANSRRKTPRIRNGFGTMWIGNIIDQLGYDWKECRCRGEITGYELEDDTLIIYQCTAWCEQEGFRYCIEKSFPSITVYYRDEEPGCEVYITNSFEQFPDRYFLDSYDEPMYFETLQEASEYVSGIVGYKVGESVPAIDSALQKYAEKQDVDDIFYSFHEFQEVY